MAWIGVNDPRRAQSRRPPASTLDFGDTRTGSPRSLALDVAKVGGWLAIRGGLMLLTAQTLAPVTRVAPTREISVLIGALFGITLLGEGQRNRRLLAAVVMLLGVGLSARG